MLRMFTIAAALTMMAGAAHADPILGSWKTKAGGTAAISTCGAQFCITLRGGEHDGKPSARSSPTAAAAIPAR